MDAVFSLKEQVIGSEKIIPYILQYTVVCPYRIHDLPFISIKIRDYYINKWRNLITENYKSLHCIAADVMLNNLRVMHDKNVLHNAIHGQNYTLALELLDFELTRTPDTPYANEKYEEEYTILFNREVIQTFEIVNYIAFFLKEELDYKVLKDITVKYGFRNILNI